MKKRTPKQIAALICVILLVLLYIVTLVVAFLDFPGAQHMFAACLLATIALPILLWIFIGLYGAYTNKHTIASLDIGGKDHVSDEEVEAIKEAIRKKNENQE